MRSSLLSEIPQGLGEQLVSLDLGDNQLAWTASNQARLATHPRLQHLFLEGNPITTAPDFSGHLYLRHLSLTGCGLTQLPRGLENLQAPTLIDLSDNLLTHLPEHFDPPRAVGHALQLSATLLRKRQRCRSNATSPITGSIYWCLKMPTAICFFQASDDQLLLWERLQVPQRLSFVRRLRELYDSFSYLLAPATTRRRLWRILEVVETQPPVDEWLAQYAGGARILLLEDMVDGVLALNGNDPGNSAATCCRSCSGAPGAKPSRRMSSNKHRRRTHNSRRVPCVSRRCITDLAATGRRPGDDHCANATAGGGTGDRLDPADLATTARRLGRAVAPTIADTHPRQRRRSRGGVAP
nr:leucine-rich repeat domain-containing protein [Pseudomonas sp. BIGb0427]